EELRICRRKRIDVERSIRIRLTESRWAARLPQEPDCGSDGDVRACSGLRVEAAAREEPPQVGEEVQVAQRACLLVDGEFAAGPIGRDCGTFDERHARQKSSRDAERPARYVRKGSVRQLVPQDGPRRRTIVRVDLA